MYLFISRYFLSFISTSCESIYVSQLYRFHGVCKCNLTTSCCIIPKDPVHLRGIFQIFPFPLLCHPSWSVAPTKYADEAVFRVLAQDWTLHPGLFKQTVIFSACGRTRVHTPISREKDREWAHYEAEWCSGMIGMEVESRARERKRNSFPHTPPPLPVVQSSVLTRGSDEWGLQLPSGLRHATAASACG